MAMGEGRVTRQRQGLNPQPLTEWLLMQAPQTTWPHDPPPKVENSNILLKKCFSY